jgi:hypothetical protein
MIVHPSNSRGLHALLRMTGMDRILSEAASRSDAT